MKHLRGNYGCKHSEMKSVKHLSFTYLALTKSNCNLLKGDEELQLEKAYLGIRVEREWYLRKLQAIEVNKNYPLKFWLS